MDIFPFGFPSSPTSLQGISNPYAYEEREYINDMVAISFFIMFF
ncbi:hypothetical protein [Providencia rustigianii]|nr:hypothetical protein [Providencia rustigianii]